MSCTGAQGFSGMVFLQRKMTDGRGEGSEVSMQVGKGTWAHPTWHRAHRSEMFSAWVRRWKLISLNENLCSHGELPMSHEAVPSPAKCSEQLLFPVMWKGHMYV